MVDGITKDVFDTDLVAVIFEVNLVGSNPKELWIDIGSTRHVCFDKKMFSISELVEAGGNVFMGNSTTYEIKGQGKVVFVMMFENEFSMTNILYVPEI